MSAGAEPRAPAAGRAVKWVVACLLSAGMIIAYCDRVNLTVALPGMARHFAWNKVEQGLALSAVFWSYTLLQIPAGALVDRIGVRLAYLCGFLVWSIASAATALTAGLAGLIGMRVLVGAGESAVAPASMRYIRLHFAEKQRGLAVGLYMSGTKLGPALGFPAAAFLVARFGWRGMFVVLGLASLVWLAPWMLLVRADDIAAAPRSESAANLSLRQILSSGTIWGIIIATYCYMYFVYYCMTWMPIYFREQYRISLTEMGWYSAAGFGGMAGVAALSGWVADRIIARGHDAIRVRKAFTIAGFAIAATQTVGAYRHSLGTVLFFSVFSLCGLGLATANYWALTHSLVPSGNIAVVIAIQNTAANLAGVLAPAVTGWMIQATGSYDAPIKTVGVWLAVGISSYLFLVKQRRIETADERGEA